MCLIETKIYVSSSGGEWEQEIAHPCKKASSGRLCSKVEHRTVTAGRIERRSSQRQSIEQRVHESDLAEPSRNGVRKVAVKYSRYVSEQDSPSSSHPSMAGDRFPPAPTPPLPSPRLGELPGVNVCPVMSGGLGEQDEADRRNASYDFIEDDPELTHDNRPPSLPRTESLGEGKRKVTITVPKSGDYATPTLSAPPLRRKSGKIEHARTDSGKAFTSDRARELQAAAAAARAEEERLREREEALEEMYQAREEACRRRQEADDEMRMSFEEQENDRAAVRQSILDAASSNRRHTPAPVPRRDSRSHRQPQHARQQANDIAAFAARQEARRIEQGEMLERNRTSRLDGERRAAEKERREKSARKQEPGLALQRRPSNAVRPGRPTPVIHYDEEYGNTQTRGEAIIANQQARLAREELAAAMQGLAVDDPFAQETPERGFSTRRDRPYYSAR